MKNIVLIGMMGCGKTTCARLLGQRLGRPVHDMDAIIEARTGRAVSEIFGQDGETVFRALESELAAELGEASDAVIATGGGAVLREDNVRALERNGILVFLRRPPEEILAGVSLEGRPLAQGGAAQFLALFARREPSYRAAARVVIEEFSSPEATVEAILKECEGLL